MGTGQTLKGRSGKQKDTIMCVKTHSSRSFSRNILWLLRFKCLHLAKGDRVGEEVISEALFSNLLIRRWKGRVQLKTGYYGFFPVLTLNSGPQIAFCEDITKTVRSKVDFPLKEPIQMSNNIPNQRNHSFSPLTPHTLSLFWLLKSTSHLLTTSVSILSIWHNKLMTLSIFILLHFIYRNQIPLLFS
jgi:hypothetical protein